MCFICLEHEEAKLHISERKVWFLEWKDDKKLAQIIYAKEYNFFICKETKSRSSSLYSMDLLWLYRNVTEAKIEIRVLFKQSISRDQKHALYQISYKNLLLYFSLQFK